MTRRPASRFAHIFAAATLAFATAACAVASPLRPYMDAVEKIRGRRFMHDVKNVTIDRSELTGRLEKEMAKGIPYPLETWTMMLRAMQLVDSDAKNVVPQLLGLYESQVLAYYDPDTKTYYSIKQLPAVADKIEDKDMLNETVAVHELTHALQDQQFRIGDQIKKLTGDTEASMAYHAVMEGEATLVMIAHMLGKMNVDLDEVVKNDMLLDTVMATAQKEQFGFDANTPPYFAESLKFPYLSGLNFVVAAYRRGGWKELDKVHANPPRTTRQVLHPNEYFSGSFKPQPFEGKKANDAKNVIAVEHMGEFHWGFLVGADNARGWVNDRVTFTRAENNQVGVAAETKWESAERAKAFADAYGAFLKKRNVNAKIEQSGASVTVRYTTNG